MKDTQVPALLAQSKSAKVAPTLAGDIISAVFSTIPGVGSIAKLAEIYSEKRLQKARDILIREIQEGNVDQIGNEQLIELFGSVIKYHDAVRQGEYEHNLKILASYIGRGLALSSLDAAEFSYDARMIEFLTSFQISLIGYCHELDVSGLTTKDKGCPDIRYLTTSHLKRGISNLSLVSNYEIESSLHILSTRGLLTPMSSTWSDGGNFYSINASIERIVRSSSKYFK